MKFQKLSMDRFNDFALSSNQLKSLRGGIEDDLCSRTLTATATYNCQTKTDNHGGCDSTADATYVNDPCSGIEEPLP